MDRIRARGVAPQGGVRVRGAVRVSASGRCVSGRRLRAAPGEARSNIWYVPGLIRARSQGVARGTDKQEAN